MNSLISCFKRSNRIEPAITYDIPEDIYQPQPQFISPSPRNLIPLGSTGETRPSYNTLPWFNPEYVRGIMLNHNNHVDRQVIREITEPFNNDFYNIQYHNRWLRPLLIELNGRQSFALREAMGENLYHPSVRPPRQNFIDYEIDFTNDVENPPPVVSLFPEQPTGVREGGSKRKNKKKS